jgi:Mg-chelatase subunit ChlD
VGPGAVLDSAPRRGAGPPAGSRSGLGRLRPARPAGGARRDVHLPLTVAQLPPDATPDIASVKVLMNGQSVTSSAVRTSRDGRVGARSVILLMDVSGSMRGARLDNARAAALTFIEEVPADVRVGLVTFAGQVSPVVPPTVDRASLRAAVQSLRARGKTQLNDGVISAVAALGPAGDRGILLLSDGAHEGSATTTEQAAAAVAAGGVGLTAVDIGGGPEAARQLTVWQLRAVARSCVLLTARRSRLPSRGWRASSASSSQSSPRRHRSSRASR